MPNKKLIEVALPLEAINAESAREKSIRHGHPSTLHLWWARRPLATARAVIWASLVDDPSSHPELFPTEEEQNAERQRLFASLQKLVVWENSNDEQLLQEARAEIAKYTDHAPLALLDPFAGGGAIPLEAQRLGLEAHAHDLNPVAVMINKAMIEIPPRFAGLAPMHPQEQKSVRTDGAWKGAKGLAEDVRYYGEWMKQEAFRRIGHLYPKVKVPAEQGGGEATVIAWIWARTVKCPNPACGCEMPLVRSFVLSKKKGKEAWVEPHFQEGVLSFSVHHGGKPVHEGTVDRRGAVCACCGTPVGFPYIREEGKQGRMKSKLCAVVVEGKNGRLYLSADIIQNSAAQIERPAEYPDAVLPHNPRDFKTPNYGIMNFADLFTNRQLTALTTFSDLVAEARRLAEQDAVAAGMKDDHIPLSEGGSVNGGRMAVAGEPVTLTAEPEEGYRFLYWTRGDSLLSEEAVLTMEAAGIPDLVAHFEAKALYVRLQASLPEGVSAIEGAGSYRKGEEAELGISLREGYRFEGWYLLDGNGEERLSDQESCIFTVEGTVRIEARVSKNQ